MTSFGDKIHTLFIVSFAHRTHTSWGFTNAGSELKWRKGKGKPFWTGRLHGTGTDGRVSSQCLRRERPVLPSKRGHVGQLWEENGGKCGKTMAEDFVVRAGKGQY